MSITSITKSFIDKIQYLFAVLVTIKQEPTILKDALFPDETGKKAVKLPDKYWRLEVLKCVWEDVPKVLTQRFCPLFWVSTIFPILWAVAFPIKLLKFIWNKILTPFGDWLMESPPVEAINDAALRLVDKRHLKNETAKKYRTNLQSLPYRYVLTELGDDMLMWDDGISLHFSKSSIEEAQERISGKRILTGLEDNETIIIYYAIKYWGENWKNELTERFLKIHKADKNEDRDAYWSDLYPVNESTPEEVKSEPSNSVPLFDWDKFKAKVMANITASKLTTYSHNFFKFIFKWSLPITGVLALGFGFVFLDVILNAVSYSWATMATLGAALWESKYGILAGLLFLFIHCLIVAAVFAFIAFLASNSDDVKEYTGKTVKTVFMPIWWPIWMICKAIAFVWSVSVLFFKVTYNENCPSIEFEKK